MQRLQASNRCSLRDALRRIVAPLVPLLVAGCSIPLDTSPPDAPSLIEAPQSGAAPALLTRDDTRARLGEPLLIGPDDTYYVYRRLVGERRWSLIWVFPYILIPDRERVDFEQIVGIWFDANGQVTKVLEDSRVCSACGEDPFRPLPAREVERIDRWMRANAPASSAREQAAGSPAGTVPAPGKPRLVIPAAVPTVVAFGVGFGVSPTQFLVESPHASCFNDARPFGDQACMLNGDDQQLSCSRMGDASPACHQSFREALNFLGIVPAAAIASGSGTQTLATHRAAGFYDGRLGSVTWTLDGSAFADVLSALRARYGPPLSDMTADGSSADSRSSPRRTLQWQDAGVTLTVALHPPRFGARRGCVSVWIRTEAHEAETAKRGWPDRRVRYGRC